MPPSTRYHNSKPVNNTKSTNSKRDTTPRRVNSNVTPKRVGSIVKIEGVSGKKRPRLPQDEEESEVEDASPLRHHVILQLSNDC